MRWTVQVDGGQASLVLVNDFFQTEDSRVEYVTIHREAVSGPRRVGRHAATEPKKVDPLVSIVVLQDTADRLDHLKILVLHKVKVVKGFR